MNTSLKNMVVLITGASGAIGSSIAKYYSNAGAKCILTYNSNHQVLEESISTLKGNGHKIYNLDLKKNDTIDKIEEFIIRNFGKLNILINCSGFTKFIPHDDLENLTDELIEDIFDINVFGPISLVRKLKKILAQNKGLIVNVSSIAAFTAMGSNIAYCASKAALDNLTKSLARALAPEIRVMSLSPGLIDTDFVSGIDQNWMDLQIKKTPINRLATADEVGIAALALATHFKSSTGSIITVDGGRSLN